MQNGSALPIVDVTLGDILGNGSRVIGVIREECATLIHLPQSEIVVSSAQLVFHNSHWLRAGNIFAPATSEATSRILCHLMLVGGDDQIITLMDPQSHRTYLLRDYAEVEDDAVQAPYDMAMAIH